MKYKVVADTNKDEFVQKVNYQISEGWEPQGGVSISVAVGDETGLIFYAQALVKKG